MENGLTGVWAVINYHTISAGIKFFLRSNGLCDKEKMPDKFPICYGDAMNILDMFFRNDKYMDRCLRIDIFERNTVFILVDDLGRDFLFDDFTEKAVWVQV